MCYVTVSNSGRQIIALGILLGFMMACFHGIALFRSVVKRRKLTTTSKYVLFRKTPFFVKIFMYRKCFPIINRKVLEIPVTVLDPLRQKLSCITAVCTVLLAASTLIVKWAILKPIHEEIMDKFKNQRPIFFRRRSICRIIDLTVEFNLFTFPVACFIILLFTITKERVSLQPSKRCYDYIGIPIPLNFFARVSRTLAAVIFGIFADELLGIANDVLNGNSLSFDKGPLWARA